MVDMETLEFGNMTGETVNDTYVFHNESALTDIFYLNHYNDEEFVYKLPAIVYTSVMMILGLPGNVIVFYIYFFKWRRSTSRIFILFLAAIDSLNCSTTLPMEIYIMRNTLKLDHPFLCKLSRYSTYTLNSSSALILLGIASDRFKRICRPYQRAFSEGLSKRISLLAIIFSMATTWPALILYGTRKVDLGKTVGSACLLENQYDATPYPILFFGYMVTSTMMIFASLIILYYFIGLQIYKHRQFKLKKCSHVQKFVDEKSITEKGNSAEKSKVSSNGKGSVEQENRNISMDVENKNVVVVDKASSVDKDQNVEPNKLGIPAALPDVGTSCGLLEVPNSKGGMEENALELPSSNCSFVSRATCEHSVHDKNIDIPSTPKKSPLSPKASRKRKRRRVRYMLVRGSSTLNASGRAKCVNCLTVRIGRSTLMLFLITIMYVVSFLPFYVIVIVRQMDKTFVPGLSTGGIMAYHVFLRSYLLSSAINPFVYSFCNSQFRELCKDAFLRLFSRNKNAVNHKFPRRTHR